MSDFLPLAKIDRKLSPKIQKSSHKKARSRKDSKYLEYLLKSIGISM